MMQDLSNDNAFIDATQRAYASMNARLVLDVDPSIRPLLIPQTLQGQASMGHGIYGDHGLRYPNVTISDIVNALGFSVDQFKKRRQGLYNSVETLIEGFLDGTRNDFIVDGEPILGISSLENFDRLPINAIDREAFLKGSAITAFMDSSLYREKTLDHYNRKTIKGNKFEMGYGETHLINKEVLELSTFDYKDLSEKAFDDKKMDVLRNWGIVVDSPGEGIESAYIRRSKGSGISDDLAFIMIGSLYGKDSLEKGVSAMLGALVVDAIDTYDKCVEHPVEGGLDEYLGELIQTSWKQKHGSPIVTDEEIMKVIYFAAKKNDPIVNVSSSHRKLVQYVQTNSGNIANQPTFLSHIKSLQRINVARYKVGFLGGMDSSTFYSRANYRAKQMLKSN